MAEGLNKYASVSVFKNVTDTTPTEELPVLQALYQINNGTHRHLVEPLRKLVAQGNTESYSEAKRKLPAFTPCGTFNGTRKAENLKTYSGFVILDIDKLSAEQVQQVKEKVSASPLTFSCFISPSGIGLKILVRVKSKPEEHALAFNQLKQRFEQLAEVEIDKSGKDLSRLCFFSYDSRIHINENATVFVPVHEPQQHLHTQPVQNNSANPDYKNIFDKCLALTLNKQTFTEGNRNNFVLLLSCNCNRNGIPQADAEIFIKHQFNYNDFEVTNTIKSAYTNNANEFGKYTQPLQHSVKNNPSTTKSVVPLGDLIRRAKEEPPAPLIWSGIGPNSLGFIFGPPKSCKTTIAENLAMSLAANRTCFFENEIKPGNYKVLFISLEEHWLQRTNRNAIQATALCEQIGNSDWMNNYIVNNEELPRMIDSPEDWLLLERIITDNKPNIVIIDSLSRLYSGSIEESSKAKEISFRLRELKDKFKITLIVIHHTTKQIGKPLTQDSLAGSRVLAQEADFALGVSKTTDGRRYFKEIFFRYKPENSETVKLFELDTHLWVQPSVDIPESEVLKERDGRESDENVNRILEFISDKTRSDVGETHTGEIEKTFVATAIMSRPTMFSCLSKLEKRQLVQKIGRGVYKAILR